ncbi:hypothetical protein AYM40_37495 (plasmid) [Paraburkholderia phytofirmans OLGA172]|uniref:Uncharacterized protein n=1 Tax=Paraburkholderia phytofirmans OLGA172 TaxID=1417228 RepID=A0A167WR21_9BURK|nr:hypothetical protein AYM40_37495 [Paraburkholderia phytofirmans OLGA172]
MRPAAVGDFPPAAGMCLVQTSTRAKHYAIKIWADIADIEGRGAFPSADFECPAGRSQMAISLEDTSLEAYIHT